MLKPRWFGLVGLLFVSAAISVAKLWPLNVSRCILRLMCASLPVDTMSVCACCLSCSFAVACMLLSAHATC